MARRDIPAARNVGNQRPGDAVAPPPAPPALVVPSIADLLRAEADKRRPPAEWGEMLLIEDIAAILHMSRPSTDHKMRRLVAAGKVRAMKVCLRERRNNCWHYCGADVLAAVKAGLL